MFMGQDSGAAAVQQERPKANGKRERRHTCTHKYNSSGHSTTTVVTAASIHDAGPDAVLTKLTQVLMQRVPPNPQEPLSGCGCGCRTV